MRLCATSFLVATPCPLISLPKVHRDSALSVYKFVENDFFDIFDVPSHGGFCRLGIVSFDGRQDPAVASQRFLRSTPHLQRAFPRVA